MTTTRGCGASGAATVAAGLVAGATAKSALTDRRPGWIRVPGRHSEAIGKSDRRQTLGADGCEKGLLRHEKAVYTSYTRFAVAVVTRSSLALAALPVDYPRGASTAIPRKPLRRKRSYPVAILPSQTSESGTVVNRSYPSSVIAKESSMLYGPGA